MFDFTPHVSTRLRRPPAAGPARESLARSNHAPRPDETASAVDQWARLDRFLIFGSECGVYYARAARFTREDVPTIARCLADDGPRVVRRLVEIVEERRAPRIEPALFVLALASADGEASTRAAALAALPLVVRTSSELFAWLEHVKHCRGWGRSVRAAVARWYTRQSGPGLARALLDHPPADRWSHRDVLRLVHPKPPTYDHDLLFRYVVRGWDGAARKGAGRSDLGGYLEAIHAVRAMSADDAARVIRIYGLTRRMLPAGLMKDPVVWGALLPGMSVREILRGLCGMARAGFLRGGSDGVALVVQRLCDGNAARLAAVHPVEFLAALKRYTRGHGARTVNGGGQCWTVLPEIVDALDLCFYQSMESISPTNRRVLLTVEVTASMDAPVLGSPALSCREAAAAMALVMAATEPRHRGVAMDERPDTALMDALSGRADVDAFVVLCGRDSGLADRARVHQALRDYRERTGIAAKLVVVAMQSDGAGAADLDDAGVLRIFGFDARTPRVINQFVGME